MRKFLIKINPFAEEDLEESFDYYEAQKEGLGKEFISEVKKTIDRIQENPKQFPSNRKGIRKAITNRFPFLIFFYIKDVVINVFAIFHSSRDPKRLKKRF